MTLIPLLKTCNQRCVFCFAEGRRDRVSLAGIFKAVDEAQDGTVALSGGETTLSPHLFRVVARARAKGRAVELQTNGLTSAYPGRAAEFAAAGIELFNVNFPSHEASVNDLLTGTRDTLKVRIQGVRNLIKCGAVVRLTHLVNTLTYKKLPAFVRFVKAELPGVDHIQFSYIKIQGLAAKNSWLVPEYEAVSPWLVKAFKACRRSGITAVADHIPPCFLGPFSARHVDYIKLYAGGDTVRAEIEKKKLPRCAGCALGSKCFGPRIDHARLLKGYALVRPVLRSNGQ